MILDLWIFWSFFTLYPEITGAGVKVRSVKHSSYSDVESQVIAHIIDCVLFLINRSEMLIILSRQLLGLLAENSRIVANFILFFTGG